MEDKEDGECSESSNPDVGFDIKELHGAVFEAPVADGFRKGFVISDSSNLTFNNGYARGPLSPASKKPLED